MHLPDGTLMAYADRQLESVEMTRVDLLVASDPELRARLEAVVLWTVFGRPGGYQHREREDSLCNIETYCCLRYA
jgi:hypothetical protein